MKRLLFTALAALTLSIAQAQTIPNAGFENWEPNPAGYSEPEGWFTSNMLSAPMFITAEPEAGAHSGNLAISITNATTGFPGFAFTQIPANQRPVALRGYYRYLPQNGDSAMVGIAFTKWNTLADSSDLIGGGEALITGTSAAAYQMFEIPITYFTSESPDTVTIMLISGSGDMPQQGSVFIVDDLEFVMQINAVENTTKRVGFKLYPNPANEACFIELNEQTAQLKSYQVTDVMGRSVLSGFINYAATQTGTIRIDSSSLSPGIYTVQLKGEAGIAASSLVITR